MQSSLQSSVAHPELSFQLPERGPEEIMLHADMSHQPVAQQITFEYAGCSGSHCATAAGTIFLLEAVMNGLAAEWLDIQDGALPAAFLVECAATVRASLPCADHQHLVGLFRRNTVSTKAFVTWARSTRGPWALAPRRVGFDGDFGRRSGRAEESLPGSPLLITEAIFEPSVFFPKAINLLLLLQAVRAIAQAVEARVRFWFWRPGPRGRDAGVSVLLR